MRQGRPKFFRYLGLAALAVLSSFTTINARAADDDAHPQVVLDTSMGPITLELDREKAPKTVDNFLKYVDSGYYNGLIFHRVINQFMIQGGGFTENMQEKGGQADPITNESRNGLSNKRGTIAMARTSDPDSATSQFFINLVDNGSAGARLDGSGFRPGYAVFGKVIEGMETVDKIAAVPTARRGQHENVPEKPVVIKSAKRKAKS